MKSHFNRYVFAAAVGSLALSGAAFAGDVASLDTDKDGKVSATEYTASAKTSFDKLDANADGKVTAAEMDAAYVTSKPGVGAAQTPSSADRIKTLDTDQDGSLSSAEHEAGSRSMFDQLDADKDGNLSADEIKAGHEAKTEGGKSY